MSEMTQHLLRDIAAEKGVIGRDELMAVLRADQAEHPSWQPQIRAVINQIEPMDDLSVRAMLARLIT